ncbi:unnamed protein product [Rotaria sp. Silwood2]|nr:unnamed protein product [Rotaria sp. Silwood2]CAF3406069.1 unnamed protein product [Rotaria sp. Silwood2]CAF4224264.1 unnamed protein product [Rotaria sp. Silwood2]CAF4256882.1 unnamed protein product [Rotaria sp. Silwood2]
MEDKYTIRVTENLNWVGSQINDVEYRCEELHDNGYRVNYRVTIDLAKHDVAKSKRELLELKYRVFYNKLRTSFNSIEIAMPILNDDDGDDQQKAFNKYEKIMKRKRIKFMVIKITEVAAKFYQCQSIFDHELSTMWKSHRNQVKNQGMSITLTNIIQKRSDNLIDRWIDIYNYRINYYLCNSYADSDHTDTNENDQKMNGIGFSFFLINDKTYELTDKQL